MHRLAMFIGAGALLSAPSPGLAQDDPRQRPDDSLVTVSGTVAAPTVSSFVLDYGQGTITVEMDDFDNFGEAYPLLDGDRVTVTGYMAANIFADRTIEAASVEVGSLNTTFYASGMDEEAIGVWARAEPAMAEISVRGTVTNIEPEADTLMLDSGGQTFAVTTGSLAYDPLDDLGFQQIDTGDEVRVIGALRETFFDSRELQASAIVTLDTSDGSS